MTIDRHIRGVRCGVNGCNGALWRHAQLDLAGWTVYDCQVCGARQRALHGADGVQHWTLDADEKARAQLELDQGVTDDC